LASIAPIDRLKYAQEAVALVEELKQETRGQLAELQKLNLQAQSILESIRAEKVVDLDHDMDQTEYCAEEALARMADWDGPLAEEPITIKGMYTKEKRPIAIKEMLAMTDEMEPESQTTGVGESFSKSNKPW
jgi:hypothetical protein